MKIKKVQPIEVRKLTTCPITMDFHNEKLPIELTDNLYAWKKMGNIFLSGIECNTSVFKKGFKFETEIGSNDAIRTLVYLGYMEIKEYSAANGVSTCRQYRLTAKGLSAVNTIAKKIGDIDEIPATSETGQVLCGICDGTGIDEEGNNCTPCKGTGTISKARSRTEIKQISPMEKNVQVTTNRSNTIRRGTGISNTTRKLRTNDVVIESLPEEPKGNPIEECPICWGEGVMKNKKTCINCDGTGMVNKRRVSRLRKF